MNRTDRILALIVAFAVALAFDAWLWREWQDSRQHVTFDDGKGKVTRIDSPHWMERVLDGN